MSPKRNSFSAERVERLVEFSHGLPQKIRCLVHSRGRVRVARCQNFGAPLLKRVLVLAVVIAPMRNAHPEFLFLAHGAVVMIVLVVMAVVVISAVFVIMRVLPAMLVVFVVFVMVIVHISGIPFNGCVTNMKNVSLSIVYSPMFTGSPCQAKNLSKQNLFAFECGISMPP